MEAVRPKKKRSELELLLGNGDAGGFTAFSPRPPALSISSPVLPEATAESDEQLARRLHEELNGMRTTRRGSKVVTEDHTPLSPTARCGASPHHRAKADAPSGNKSHNASAATPGRASASAVLPPVAEAVDPPAASEAGAAPATEAPGPAGGGTTSGSNEAAAGGGEVVKRKRNSVPARELHLLLQQASSTSGRVGLGDATLSPTRSGRGGLAACRWEPPSALQASNFAAGQDAQAPRRDSDGCHSQQQQQQQQDGVGAGAAPAATTPAQLPISSSSAPQRPPPRLPPELSSLPPKLKQRYLAGLHCPPPAPPPGASSAAASATSDAATAAAAAAAAGMTTSFTTADAITATAITPDSLLGAAGSHCPLLSGQCTEAPGSSQASQSHPRHSRRDVEASASASAAAGGGAFAAPPAPGSGAGTGASIGGCSSTDETEHDFDHGCAAAVAGAGPAGGGLSATSPKAPAPAPASAQPDARELGPQAEGKGPPPQAQSVPQQTASRGQHPGKQAPKQQAPKQGQGPLKVPKLPMIRAGRGWFRGRLLQESPDGLEVLVDVPGAPNPGGQPGQPIWLPTTSDRIWRGSYKGKDWKYLGEGAWDPKPAAFKRGKQGSSSNGLPLPLPQWAVVEGSPPQPANLLAPRSKRDRGSAGVDEMSENVDAQDEEDEEEQLLPQSHSQELQKQQQQPAPASAREGPSSRPQRGQRRGASPAAAPTSSAELPGASSVGAVGDDKGAAGAPAATAASDDAAAALSAAEMTAAGCGGGLGPEGAGINGSGAAGAAAAATAGVATKVEPAEAEPAGLSEPTGPCCGAAGTSDAEPPAAEEAGPRDGMEVDTAAGREGGGEGTGGAGVEAGASGRLEAVKGEGEEGGGAAGGDAADGNGDEGACWVPGLPYPRTRALRRARQRQRRWRSPLDGLQLPLQSHHHHHNPYAMFSGDESAGEGDAGAGASDAEHGGRRGSDGTGAAYHGGRRRAAARAAAVAAAAARAEAEAEEEEQEEILMGRRPPRRDRDRDRDPYNLHHGGPGSKRHSNYHHSNPHPRSRNTARPDCYLYGDSSGALDDSFMPAADGAVQGQYQSSVRQRGSRAASQQPATEPGSGGSMGWESSAQWLQAMGGHGAAPGGCAAGGGGAAPMAQRNRRKGKPSRSRMDGEGELCCYWDEEWELEATGSVWARMPQAVRQLYYISAGTDDGTAAAGGHQQQSGGAGSKQHRNGGTGYYHGAQAGPNKRRRVYDEDPAMSPDDDLEIVDDPDQDADYLPYSGPGNGRRSSGYGGGRRCSGNGSGWGGSAAKRQRSGGDAALLYGDLAGGYAAPAAPLPPRRRILISYGPVGLGAGAARGWSGDAGGRGGGGIPASLAGLLEAALGQDPADPQDGSGAEGATALGQPGGTQAVANDTAQSPPPGPQVIKCDHALTGAGGMAGPAGGASASPTDCHAGVGPGGCEAAPGGDNLTEAQVAQQAAQVALSDSSANHSSAGEEAGKGPLTLPCNGSAAADGAVLLDAAADGSTPLPLTASGTCSQQQASGMSPEGRGVGGTVAGGSPPPSSVALRPGTPTRARRTGRPPSAVFGTGAPLPRLPALSSGASLRLHIASSTGGGGGGSAAAVTVVDGSGSTLACEQAAVPAAEGAVQLPSYGAAPMDEQGPRDPRVDASSAMGVGHSDMCRGGGGSPRTAGHGGDCRPEAGVCSLWQGATLSSVQGRRTASPVLTQVAAGQQCDGYLDGSAGPDLGPRPLSGLGYERASSAGAATTPPPPPAGASGCCVMDAIGALMYDSNQPAMQQLAMRAQLELDSMSLAINAQYQLVAATAAAAAVQDGQPHQQQLLECQQSAGRGRGAAAGPQRTGSLPYSVGGALYGIASAAMMPPVPEAVVAALPSVEVVVDLFSVRAPFGAARQALADFVGGAAALPLFR